MHYTLCQQQRRMIDLKARRNNLLVFNIPEPSQEPDTDCEKVQYIPINMHTVFALLCFVVVIHWLIYPYPSGLLHWHCGNLTIVPVPAKQPWWIWINTSFEFITNDYITTTKQSTTKPCAYFLGYTVLCDFLATQLKLKDDQMSRVDRGPREGGSTKDTTSRAWGVLGGSSLSRAGDLMSTMYINLVNQPSNQSYGVPAYPFPGSPWGAGWP